MHSLSLVSCFDVVCCFLSLFPPWLIPAHTFSRAFRIGVLSFPDDVIFTRWPKSPWPHISGIMLTASVTKQSPCWDSSTIMNLIGLNTEGRDLTLRDWLRCLISLCFRFSPPPQACQEAGMSRKGSLIVPRYSAVSHHPPGSPTHSWAGWAAGLTELYRTNPLCPPLILLFQKLILRSCIWECSWWVTPESPSLNVEFASFLVLGIRQE